jgi:hypothetical protein
VDVASSLQTLGFTRKRLKIRSHLVDEGDIARFYCEISRYDTAQLVFVDASHTRRWDQERLWGWALSGQEAAIMGIKDHSPKTKIHIMAAITENHYLTPVIFSESLNTVKLIGDVLPLLVRPLSHTECVVQHIPRTILSCALHFFFFPGSSLVVCFFLSQTSMALFMF